VKSDLNHDPFS